MRTIKFRAWDKVRKEMNYKVQIGNTDMEDPNYTCNSILLPGNGCWMNADHVCIDIMQFTGLLDKNGKEIYEGDIIHSYMGGTTTVFWRDESCGFFVKNDNNEWPLCGIPQPTVIGNIHEK